MKENLRSVKCRKGGGMVAQWAKYQTCNQEVKGSTPGRDTTAHRWASSTHPCALVTKQHNLVLLNRCHWVVMLQGLLSLYPVGAACAQ